MKIKLKSDNTVHETIEPPEGIDTNPGSVWIDQNKTATQIPEGGYEEVNESESKEAAPVGDGENPLTAYNVKTKKKGVPIRDAVIKKTAKGAFMVMGHDGAGNKLTTLVNEEKALSAIKKGWAKQGW